jgi:uncharacterized membrane protein YccF (DUF307 family)
MYMQNPPLRYSASMSPLDLLLNVIWLICGGALGAFAWLVAALVMALTIIGLPWSFAAFRIALYTALPFGHEMRRRLDAGELTLLGNLVWFVLAGWWLALIHLVVAIVLAVTIIGLPFAWAHLKLAGASLAPVGKEIVPHGAPRYWA